MRKKGKKGRNKQRNKERRKDGKTERRKEENTISWNGGKREGKK